MYRYYCARLYSTDFVLQANVVVENVSLSALYHVPVGVSSTQVHIVELLRRLRDTQLGNFWGDFAHVQPRRTFCHSSEL